MANKYRSKYEKSIGDKLPSNVKYEPFKVEYFIPATKHTYTPDWVWGDYWLEAKGRLDGATRKKMALIRKQYPDQKIVFIFQNPNVKIYKGSPTTYREWASANGFIVWSVGELLLKVSGGSE